MHTLCPRVSVGEWRVGHWQAGQQPAGARARRGPERGQWEGTCRGRGACACEGAWGPQRAGERVSRPLPPSVLPSCLQRGLGVGGGTEQHPPGVPTFKVNIRTPASGQAADGKESSPFQRTFFSPTHFTIKATFNHIEIYFPLWGLDCTDTYFFFLKSNCHTWDFISALLVQ